MYKLSTKAHIDTLAPALGSVHGKYKGEPNLGFEEMKEIQETIDIPLVLHGASGISDEDLVKAIKLGHAKLILIPKLILRGVMNLEKY